MLAAACPSDPAPVDTTLPESSSSGDAMTMTTTATTESGSTSEVDTSSSSTDPTVDPTTESSSTDPTIAPESTGEPAVCGDGVISGEEACDGDVFADDTCQTQGFMSGFLVCSQDCLGFNTHNCYICGDGEIQGTEECDGPLDNDVTCEGLGFTEGPISCDMSNCQFDISQCTLCGDGVAEGAEYCDMNDLFGESCDTLGFSGGTLACHSDTCGYDYTLCEGGMYIQDFEGCALPPEFTFTGNANWTADATSPITGSCSAHNLDIGDSQTAGMVLNTIWAIDGTCDFSKRTDSEGSFDYLEFYIDGVLQMEWSGVAGAVTMESFPVTAGNHTLEWRFIKDGSVTSGSDTVFVDDIVLFGGVPI